MSRTCIITGKKPLSGNNVSHSNVKRRRRFLPNLHNKRFCLENGRYVRLRVTTKGIRIIDKYGIDYVLKNIDKFLKNVNC